MTTHKTNKREYIFEIIDEDAKDIYIGLRMYKYNRMFSKFKRTCHAGCKIIGLASELTEEQAKELVEVEDLYFHNGEVCYTHYGDEYSMVDTAKESLTSLILSKGMKPEKTLIIERKS